MKRSLKIKHNNGSPDKELEIGKAVAIGSSKEFIYWEKMGNGKWQLTFSKGTVEDFSTVESFEMVRED